MELAAAHDEIRAEAVRLAGGPGDMPPRVALMHSIFVDSGGNHVFPEVALHGALWAYGFYERRGTVSRMISSRYFYDREERARRAYMLFEFSQGFKEANRSVFIDTYTNYFFTKRHGEPGGGGDRAARAARGAEPSPPRAAGRPKAAAAERAQVFETALLFEQETTVGPKVKEEVAKFDCPVLTTIVLKPIVHFAYFPRTTLLRFHDFSDKEERIEKAVRAAALAEDAGWPNVGTAIRYAGVLPGRFFDDPLAYADSLGQRPAVVVFGRAA